MGINTILPAAFKSIRDTEDKIARFQSNDQDATERLTKILNFQQGVLDRNKKREAMLERPPLAIGNVLVSSGDVVSSIRSILGWAIVELPTSKVPQPQPNTLPSTKEVARAGKSPIEYGLDDVNSYERLNGHECAQGFAEIEKGAWYFKIGRASGITTGICHSIEVDVGRNGQINKTVQNFSWAKSPHARF